VSSVPHISVCICTYRRPVWLRRLLDALLPQQTGGLFTFSVVVADNDASESARSVVSAFQSDSALSVTYCAEQVKNFALVRNCALSHATGDWIAFIDDDEFPGPHWLLDLYKTASKQNVAGVLGPVVPHFEVEPPHWVKRCELFHRPRHKTGFTLQWQECRTGNVLFRRSIIPVNEPPFRAEFATGGEDQDFFRRMSIAGQRFIWCDEAIVWETVPPERWDKQIMLSRALLRGKNSLQHESGRLKNISKSLVALPLYSFALPLLRLRGEHSYVKYLVKWGDHAGRLLGVFGLNPVQQRKG
jgi:glycosyltransferase involved in cell wall biosynthesis